MWRAVTWPQVCHWCVKNPVSESLGGECWGKGAVAFIGAGEVANEFGDFKFGKLEYSYGAGLRYVFNKKEGINLRADLGFGENTTGLYISVEEAF